MLLCGREHMDTAGCAMDASGGERLDTVGCTMDASGGERLGIVGGKMDASEGERLDIVGGTMDASEGERLEGRWAPWLGSDDVWLGILCGSEADGVWLGSRRCVARKPTMCVCTKDRFAFGSNSPIRAHAKYECQR